jgi:hypothetical protein
MPPPKSHPKVVREEKQKASKSGSGGFLDDNLFSVKNLLLTLIVTFLVTTAAMIMCNFF